MARTLEFDYECGSPSHGLRRNPRMMRIGLPLAAAALLAAMPSSAQTVGSCARGGGANQPPPVWVLFDLGSAHVRPADKPAIAEAVKTAKDRQVSSICVVGHTDKLGDKALNARLARERSQAVAAELIRAGYPANHIVIAADPEAFGNMSLGSSNASEKDRRVTILFSR
jgi:outer membrane protein OmpA-like peptidoglycan-associated protein